MLNTFTRKSLVAGWFAMLAIIIALSTAAGAGLSMAGVLLAVGVAPVIVIMRLARHSPPTVAEILHTAETGDGRR